MNPTKKIGIVGGVAWQSTVDYIQSSAVEVNSGTAHKTQAVSRLRWK
jgi:aspartate/glutamate racemase